MPAKFKSPLGSSCVSSFGRGEVLALAEGLLELVMQTQRWREAALGISAFLRALLHLHSQDKAVNFFFYMVTLIHFNCAGLG